MSVCAYYQTFEGLDEMKELVDEVIVASVHMHVDPTSGKKGLHLNHCNPWHFLDLWVQLANLKGMQKTIMVGGAGLAFEQLFASYHDFYPLLLHLLKHTDVNGVDLDIEEPCSVDNVCKLVRDLVRDLPTGFRITMSPVYTDLISASGFDYETFQLTPEARMIDRFRVQFYGQVSLRSYETVLAHGYPASKVVVGTLAGTDDLVACLLAVAEIKKKYPDLAGVATWEWFYSGPSWAREMKKVL